MEAEAAISFAVKLIDHLLNKKVKSLQGVVGQVQTLKEELEWMQYFLKEANKKKDEAVHSWTNKKKDEAVRNWIDKIRRVAQDAGDATSLFLDNIDDENNKGLLKRCTSFSKRMHHIDRFADEIKSIQTRLEEIENSREMYGIADFLEAATQQQEWRLQVELRWSLYPWQMDEHAVGIEDDVRKILRESILNVEKKGLSIVVLEGMDGIGKSTLARRIYNHPDIISGPFEFRSWVVMSKKFTPQETMKQLIFQMQRSEEDKAKLVDEIEKLGEEFIEDKMYVQEELKEMFHKLLEGKSYFIVVDDTWIEKYLVPLINALPNQQDKASRLLVTTRSTNCSFMSDIYLHKMKLLDLQKGWELLLKKTFIGSTNGEQEELETIGRQILEKCHGLPLAISLVGGLLVETNTKRGWEQVLNQINFSLGGAERNLPLILELSYQNLSPQLKSCFLCLAFFKEDSTIPTKRLVDIWDAQGLIQQEGIKSIHEIGRGYLIELINRGMLQIQDLTIDDRIKNCHLHHLIRDVCLRKATEEMGVLQIVGREESMSFGSSYEPHHCVLDVRNLNSFLPCQNKQHIIRDLNTFLPRQTKHIRSLFLHNIEGNRDFIMFTPSYGSYEHLKTLDIDGFAFERFPDSFRVLIALKCLRIRNSYLRLELPNWLGELKHLEVLDMENCRVDLPRKSTFKMDRLRVFHADIIVCGLTKKISWENIECLKHICYKCWMRSGSSVSSGCRLHELGIRFDRLIEHKVWCKVRSSLEKMQNLVILHLMGIGYVLDVSLAMPNHLASLTKLRLEGPLHKCPTATTFPPNLSHLTLQRSFLSDDPMTELGKLQKLSFLKLKHAAYLGETMQVLCDGFPGLEAMAIVDLLSLKVIDIEEGGMPKLKHLRICNCPSWRLATNLPKHINILIQ